MDYTWSHMYLQCPCLSSLQKNINLALRDLDSLQNYLSMLTKQLDGLLDQLR